VLPRLPVAGLGGGASGANGSDGGPSGHGGAGAQGSLGAALTAHHALVVLRLVRGAAAKLVWRSYLPEVPPA
jgi:hypothetical protein